MWKNFRLQRASHNSQKFMLEDKLKHYLRDIKDAEVRISGLEVDIETTRANTHLDEKGFSRAKIMGTDFTEKAEAGKQILKMCKRTTNPEARPLGECRGIKTEIGFDTMQKQYFITLIEKLPSEHKAKWFAGTALNTAEQSMNSVMSTALSRLNAFLDTEMEQILCFDTAVDLKLIQRYNIHFLV